MACLKAPAGNPSWMRRRGQDTIGAHRPRVAAAPKRRDKLVEGRTLYHLDRIVAQLARVPHNLEIAPLRTD